MSKTWIPVFGLIGLMVIGAAVSFAVNAGAVVELKSISVTGDITIAQRNAIFRTLADHQVTAKPISELQKKLETQGWVHSVTIERRWPDALQVSVTPERAIALWNDDAYLNDLGEVFTSPFVNQSKLPQLYGPVGKEALVMRQYQQLNASLFNVNQNIEMLTLDARFNWTLQSDEGIEVLLGKTALMERIQRLLKVTEHIRGTGRLENIAQIDTRYGNGVAVSWKSKEWKSQAELNVATNYNSQREAKL